MRVEIISITPAAERVIAEAARTCYLSFDRQSEDADRNLIRSLIRRGHHSVLEHASATFRIKGCSRAFTHQLVRHRLCAFSQQSQRYVDEFGFRAVIPPRIAADPAALNVFQQTLESIQHAYHTLRDLGIPREDARFLLPTAAESEIVFSANFRQLRHMLIIRGAPPAQWEIRRVFVEILRRLKREVPLLVEDMEIDEERGAIVPASIEKKEAAPLKNLV